VGSFSKLSRWPVGYFRAISSWLLRNRREVPARIATLTAEVDRIGFIRVYYRVSDNDDGSRTVTEDRMGLTVTEGSSLHKLLQAYIAQGGNPFDISPFWHPDEASVVGYDGAGNPVKAPDYPHGGIVSLKSAAPNEPLASTRKDDDGNTVYEATGFENHPGGDPDTERFYTARLGTQAARSNLDIPTVMHKIRGWANQEIKERLQDIEWRVVKLMDLREQLTRERDEVLQQAFGGALPGLPGFDEARFNPALTVQSLIQDMYELIYVTGEDGRVLAFRANDNVALLNFTFEDVTSELRTPAGG